MFAFCYFRTRHSDISSLTYFSIHRPQEVKSQNLFYRQSRCSKDSSSPNRMNASIFALFISALISTLVQLTRSIYELHWEGTCWARACRIQNVNLLE